MATTGPGTVDVLDPRVERSRREWRATRQALNANRHALAQVAAGLYPERVRLGSTGLLARPDWLPDAPVEVSAIVLEHDPTAPEPVLTGVEPATEHTRPQRSPVHRYGRYSEAIGDLARPRLFEDRHCWRITDLSWDGDKGRMGFTDSGFFTACDVFESLAHELAHAAVTEDAVRPPAMRDLPFRRLLGDPFDLARRPVILAVATLTIRRGADGAEFLLHRRDPRAVTAAGGMVHVIPCGIFQPSTAHPIARQADFDLWRTFMREFSEELLGNPERYADGQPIRYDGEPFTTLDQARHDGRIRMHCLGVALDALTLVGEVLTVAVVEADLFDELDRNFADRNDEGQVVAERVPFTADAIDRLFSREQLAPAGAGCVSLAWRFRDLLVGRAS